MPLYFTLSGAKVKIEDFKTFIFSYIYIYAHAVFLLVVQNVDVQDIFFLVFQKSEDIFIMQRIIDSIPNVFGGKPTSQMYLGGAAFDSTTIDPIRGNS